MKVNVEIISKPDFPRMERKVSTSFTASVAKLSPLGAKYLAGIIQTKSSELRDSIGHSNEAVWSTSDYYKYVDLGTRPHVIQGLLRFEINGVVIFARNVQHPGTKAQNLTERMIEHIEDNIPQVVKDVNKVIT